MKRRDWMFHDLVKTAVESFDKGHEQSAVRDLVRAIKIIGLGSKVGSFVSNSIAPADRKECFSTAEAWEAYRLQMEDLRQPRLSKGEFEKLLPQAMRDIYGIVRGKNISRNGKQVRGYYGAVLKPGGLPLSPLRKDGDTS
jgi:hypothetical protein